MKFDFQGRTKEGELQTGVVEAPTKDAALALLYKYGLYVTLLEEKAVPFWAKKLRILGGSTKRDLVLFSRQLAVMFRSKVPLVEALETLASQTRKADFKEKLLKLTEDVEGGVLFSEALSHYPKLFTPLFIAVVKSGEASGRLSESLDYLANHLEREYELQGKIKGAMVYPLFILFFAVVVVALMVNFVLPQLTTILKESGQNLPFMTKLVIAVADFLRSRGLFLILLFLGFFVLAFKYINSAEGKRIFDRFSLKIPFIGEFLKKIYISRLAENLSTLIASGLPIARALEISGNVVGNATYKKIIAKTQAEVKRGESISSVLSSYPEVFPPVFSQMTLVGEKTGTLDSILMNIVDFYQKDIDRSINSLLSLIEPLMIVGLGIAVAIFAIAVITPVYQMMGKGV